MPILQYAFHDHVHIISFTSPYKKIGW